MNPLDDRPALEAFATALAFATIACIVELALLRSPRLVAYALPLVDGVGATGAFVIWRFGSHDAALYSAGSPAARFYAFAGIGTFYGILATPGLLAIAFVVSLSFSHCPYL